MPNITPIIQPIVTEKSSRTQEGKRYTFLVNKKATKIDIKNAIKEIYGVEAAEVKTMILPKKVRVIGKGREITKRPVYKKAIVTLKGGKTIDPNKFKEVKKK